MPKAKMKRKGAGADLFATDTSRVTSFSSLICDLYKYGTATNTSRLYVLMMHDNIKHLMTY